MTDIPSSWASDPLTFIVVLALLSLLPFILVMTTSFIKISVVLSILRTAIGTPQIPPTMVVNGLAMILTAYVMAPVGFEMYESAESSIVAKSNSGETPSVKQLFKILDRSKEPLREFLIRHSKLRDRKLFQSLSVSSAKDKSKAQVMFDEKSFSVIVPAFAIGQLAAAFQIGFILFVPFLVIDMIVSNILLALGMHMLSPTTVSLPFKLLLFVLVDGWRLLTEGLVRSYGG